METDESTWVARPLYRPHLESNQSLFLNPEYEARAPLVFDFEARRLDGAWLGCFVIPYSSMQSSRWSQNSAIFSTLLEIFLPGCTEYGVCNPFRCIQAELEAIAVKMTKLWIVNASRLHGAPQDCRWSYFWA